MSFDLQAHMSKIARNRLGLEGYARIIGCLRNRARDAAEISSVMGVAQPTVSRIMRHCVRAGAVHRCRWHQPGPRRSMVPVYALGPGADVSMPLYEFPQSSMRPPSTLILLTTVLEMVREDAMSRQDIADELKMGIESAQRVIGALRKNRLVYVASWDVNGTGRHAEEFREGCKADVPSPGVANSAERHRQWRARRTLQRTLNRLTGQAA